ncbi:hypothetical protein PMAYCL1PPCAC_17293, partial [Pristionchus mayeri]
NRSTLKLLGLLNDIYAQFIFDPIIHLPLPCTFRNRERIEWDTFRLVLLQVIWVGIVSQQATAYIACYIHRHQAVLSPNSKWRIKTLIRRSLIISYSIIILTPTAYLKVISETNTNSKISSRYLSPEWPSDVIDRIDCSTFDLIQPYITSSAIMHSTSVSIVVVLIVHTFHQLNKSLSMSVRRREYQRTMMRILLLQRLFQSLLPIIVQVLPNVAGFTVFVFGWSGSAVYPVILLVLSSNSLALSVVLLGTTPLYISIIKTSV